MRGSERYRAWILGALLLSAAAAADEPDAVRVCRNGNGEVVLQQEPCPEARSAAPADAEPLPRAAATPSQPPTAHRAPVAEPPLPAVRTKPGAWTLVPRIPDSRRAARRELGPQSFPTRLERIAPPSFVTPETTWRSFLSAIEGGDLDAARACFADAALERLDSDGAPATLEGLRATLRLFERIENGGDAGPFWVAYGVRQGQRRRWILFEQTESGDWRIAGL